MYTADFVDASYIRIKTTVDTKSPDSCGRGLKSYDVLFSVGRRTIATFRKDGSNGNGNATKQSV